MNPSNKCECCGQTNMAALLDPKFQYCCYPCVEAGECALCEDTGCYIQLMPCRGCGAEGPANYYGGDDLRYYCGGSPGCCP